MVENAGDNDAKAVANRRLAEELRANLMRRKAQARSRRAEARRSAAGEAGEAATDTVRPGKDD